ncbi:anti-sigma factor family protein [Streptomyces goshikiensis]|uniref:anti-sigma factor family protein n=1 Tax=Streptomyces goshikiensis TaxID=1942 RepID=UPI0037A580E5
MTHTTGTIRHPDVSEISELTEGLLSPARTAEVRRHLGDCDLCADVQASLEEIRALLGTLPGPARMPSDVAGRIDAALAAEALLDSTAHRTDDPPSAQDHTGVPPVAPPAEADTETPAAPAAPAVPALPAAGSGGRRPAGHPSGATGPGRRRARRRIAVVAGLAGAGAFALAVFLLGGPTGTPSHDTATRGRAESSAAQPSADTYTAQGLRSSVQQLLAASDGAKAETGGGNKTFGLENTTPAPGVAPQDRAVPSVPPCVQEATGRPDAPLATERGSYQGTPVYLVVLPHPGDAARVDAYLVDAGCVNTPTTAPGKPLLTSTYPRS